MKLRYLVAAGAATALVLTACSSTGSGGGGQSSAATGTLTVWLQTDAQTGLAGGGRRGHHGVQRQAPRREGRRRVAAVVRPPDQARLHVRRQRAARRRRARQHPDGQVHRRRCVRRHHRHKGQFDNSGTWLKGLADSGTSRRQAVRRAVLRRQPRRHLPQGPHGRKAGITSAADHARRVQRRHAKIKAAYTRATRSSRRSTCPGKYWYARDVASSTATAARSPRRQRHSGGRRWTRPSRSRA